MTNVADYAFLHGGGQGGWVWRETLAALERQTDGKFGRALALDVPGCGQKRGRKTENLVLADVVDELLSDIAAAGLKNVVLVGHSQAGTVLPGMVQKRPDLFRRLVYVSCVAPLPGQSTVETIGTSRQGEKEDEIGWPLDPETTSMEDRFRAMFCNDMSEAETSAFLAKLGKDMWPEKVTYGRDYRYDHLGAVPSAYVLCLRDNILTPPWQQKFAERFKVERVVRIDAGHQVMNTRPQALAEALRHEAAI